MLLLFVTEYSLWKIVRVAITIKMSTEFRAKEKQIIIQCNIQDMNLLKLMTTLPKLNNYLLYHVYISQTGRNGDFTASIKSRNPVFMMYDNRIIENIPDYLWFTSQDFFLWNKGRNRSLRHKDRLFDWQWVHKGHFCM